MVSDIMGKIMDLPEESKEHLTHLIQHGEIPEKYMEDKFVSILFSNKIIVKREEGKSEGPLMDFVRLATLAVEEVVDFIPLFADSILGTTSNLEHKTAEVKEPEKISMVGAKVNLPGGVFDLRKFLVVRRGSDATVEEEDDVKYPSNKIAEMLSVILNARVKPQGLIFMPYYLCSYVDENTHSLIRREILFIPKFIPPEETKRAREVKKPVKKTQTHVGIPYKILK